MKKETKEAKGLLAIWADVDEDYRVEYQKWHNFVHVLSPARVELSSSSCQSFEGFSVVSDRTFS
jgi:hypothetical protein